LKEKDGGEKIKNEKKNQNEKKIKKIRMRKE